MIHAHITAWFSTLVLFAIALILNKNGKAKGFKVVQMITRVFYLFIIATGSLLLLSVSQIGVLYIIKAVTGLWIISLIELIMMKAEKNSRKASLWIQFVIAFLLVLYLGFKLPLGVHIF